MKLLLIDLSSVFYPAWHMRDGKDTNFPYQVTIERVRTLAAPHDHVAVLCDSGRSFRKDISPEYKANRPDKDEALIDQITRAEETLAKDGYLVLRAPGFEADDLIATMVAWADPQDQIETTVASSDKDLLSLVDERVRIYSLTKGVTLGIPDVEAKFGVKPWQMRDFLALCGDSSDNVRGIPGVGPKTAAKLLTDFGDIAGIYSALKQAPDDVATPSVRKALAENVGNLDIAIKLVTLRTDAPIDCAAVLLPREVKPLAQVNEGEFTEEEDVETDPTNQAKSEPTTAMTNTVTDLPKPATAIQRAKLEEAPAPEDWDKALEPRTPGQAVVMAGKLFDSRMFAGYGNENAVLSTILLGRELGIGAMGSLRGIHNIKGKHALSADLMAALVIQSGKAKFFEPVLLTATKATYRTHRIGSEKPFEMTFDFEEARVAGLVKDDSGWAKWPIDMCKARCIARLARTIYPDVCFGLYVQEELESINERAAA